ncbi:hypothetical protein XFF6990_140350 [Xanthomonas citri pv. fuscans]|nr:hypothetical protein XFF6990_140350 [Xanthomonas citri pv. fuscans]
MKHWLERHRALIVESLAREIVPQKRRIENRDIAIFSVRAHRERRLAGPCIESRLIVLDQVHHRAVTRLHRRLPGRKPLSRISGPPRRRQPMITRSDRQRLLIPIIECNDLTRRLAFLPAVDELVIPEPRQRLIVGCRIDKDDPRLIEVAAEFTIDEDRGVDAAKVMLLVDGRQYQIKPTALPLLRPGFTGRDLPDARAHWVGCDDCCPQPTCGAP